MSPKHSHGLARSLGRGATGRCPRCGQGRLYDGYLTLNRSCWHCGLDLRPHAPAAGPAFLTVALLSLTIGPLIWAVAAIVSPDRIVLALVGLAILPIAAVLLLRVMKGAVVAYLWSLGIRSARVDGRR